MSVPRNFVTEYGFRVHAPGYITPEEARAWLEDLKLQVIALGGKPFGLMVDSRTQRANPTDTQELIRESMVWLRDHGMVRSVVVLDSTVALMQVLGLAKATGVYAYERYVDSLKDPNWEARALDWIIRAIDPDLSPPEEEQER
ncbi:hypothetical protein JRI60_44855 [Archangium violaceum]|uniref:hypothetical protein n=1 Tax=Archangium violaceum TaxID=83451 RepID=UPI00194F7CB9|nr:hypothetical protein [Archangium violaceum]QRN96088.1 hypothetical protein JRI60_44855 [Archangium violaceum]